MTRLRGFLLLLIILSAFFVSTQSLASSESHWGTRGWLQFPSNDFSPQHDPGIEMTSSAQLALTAEGPDIAMSYTVATYELKALPGRDMMELQIHDALLSPSPGRDQGFPAIMDLVFGAPLNDEWRVDCWNEDMQDYETLATPLSNRMSIGITENPCQFRAGQWSNSLRIHFGSQKRLLMKTVWAGTDAEHLYMNKPASYQNLLNVFRFQSRFGVVRLARTSPDEVHFNHGDPLAFRSSLDKSIYEQNLNWSVLYKTEMKTFFSFEIDVSDHQGNYLLLWDKDADANRLFTAKGKAASKPPDNGLKMMLRWSDGSPLEYDLDSDQINGGIPITQDPEWTHFDQTNREGFFPAWHLPGETNRFDGPSWDTDHDPLGEDSLRWYRIPLHERKSDTLLVAWYGSTVPLNAFAFAASAPLSPAPCSDPSRCREIFDLPEKDPVQVCPESNHEDCVLDDRSDVKISIDSNPAPETSNLLEKNISSLEYILNIENKKSTPLTDLSLVFLPPDGTHLSEEEKARYGPGNRLIIDDLDGFESRSISLHVLLNEKGNLPEIISTRDQIFLYQGPDLTLEPSIIRHYPGELLGEDSGCRQEGSISVCISSNPLPDPSPESYGLDPQKADKNQIEYLLKIQNISASEEAISLKNIGLLFENPLYSSLHEDFRDLLQSPSGDFSTGKGTGVFELKNELTAGESLEYSFVVALDILEEMTDYDISSEGKFRLRFDNHPQVEVPGLVHHVGAGGVQIEVSRCYAFDYFGGDYQCSDSCQAVESGTRITVRDTLKNVGGASALNYLYSPLPLSSAFFYDANSIRLDDPETGLRITNDGQDFPPAKGILVAGSIPSQQKRVIYFSYGVPEDILEENPNESGCFPDDDEEISPRPSDSVSPEIRYEQECSAAGSSGSQEKNGKICVHVEPRPRLEATLTALPLEGSTLYQGSSISYFLEISNQTKQAVSLLSIEALQAQQTQCRSGLCSDISVENPPELSQKFGSLQMHSVFSVNDDAQGERIFHPGYRILYQGDDGEELEVFTNNVEHELLSIPEASGDFQHDITLNRRTVLNAADRNQPRADEADRVDIAHEFSFSGTQVQPVWPDMNGSRNHRMNVCNWQFPSYEYYDATFAANSTVYNSSQRNQSLRTFENIRSDDLTFRITTQSPEDRPELLVMNGKDEYTHEFSFPFSGTARGPRGLNGFMKQGGTIRSAELQTTPLRAVRDGVAGQVDTVNTAVTPLGESQIMEDRWWYTRTGTRTDWLRCTRCTTKYCYRYNASVPIYKWKLLNSRAIPMKTNDRDYLSVLTSVAWLQTKHGHMGFGSPLWETDPHSGDPNWVQLADKALPSVMKWYSPPDQANADLLVLHSGSQDPLESELGSSGRVVRSLAQGFLDSPLEDGKRQPSRGDPYDREENPRDYLEDLLKRQLYGKVVRLNTSTSLPPGITRNGSVFQISGALELENDTIYHLQGELRIGQIGANPVILQSGRARLIVDGNAQILSNVHYASSDASDLSRVTSIRLHSLGDLQIHPTVTEVELMMQSEGRFSSGKSDKQLRILGDVIAQTAAWERRPLNAQRNSDEEVNKPSELIIEDFRKYLVAPPGDKKLNDVGWWRE